jgi:diguanylate cyclase (GGDEF)-like protein/PAS domain S-box-containing protein
VSFVDAYTVALIIAAVLSLMLAGRAFAWPVSGAREFGFVQVGIAAYALAYAAELGSTSLPGALRAIRFEYLGIVLMMVFWVLFAIRFSGHRRLAPLLVALIAFLPACTLVIVWTDQLHHLFYASAWMRDIGPAKVLEVVRGPWYWVHVANFWIFLALNIAIFLPAAARSSAEKRGQIMLAVWGSSAPAAAELVHLVGVVPYDLDPIPLAFCVTGLLFATAVFQGRFLALALAARGSVLEAMAEGVIVVDPHGALADANPAAAAILGLEPDAVGRKLADLLPLRTELCGVMETGSGRAEFLIGDQAGGSRRFAAAAFPVRDEAEHFLGTAAIIADITEASARVDRLTELAMTDGLTGLLNRRSFMSQGEREFEVARRAARPIAAAIFDIDRFKRVNDSHGHAAGDAVLREVAVRFSRSMRAGDSLCRYGGEEFALVMPETNDAGALIAAERLRQAVGAEALSWEDSPIRLTASAGVFAAVPRARETLEDFLAKADEALYEAKRGGRNRLELRPDTETAGSGTGGT